MTDGQRRKSEEHRAVKQDDGQRRLWPITRSASGGDFPFTDTPVVLYRTKQLARDQPRSAPR